MNSVPRNRRALHFIQRSLATYQKSRIRGALSFVANSNASLNASTTNSKGAVSTASHLQCFSSNANAGQKSYVEGSTTHFGFEDVPIEEKESKVRTVFQNVAESYDVMNDLMSGGLHRYWKDELLSMTGVEAMSTILRSTGHSGNDINSGSQLNILDVAGGTGDVAFRFLEAAKCPERSKSSGLDDIAITVCDINPDMLRVGERRARERYGDAVLDKTQALTFREGNAQSLPFDDNTFDLYTIAFGLRNVTDVDMALRDAKRVLKVRGDKCRCGDIKRPSSLQSHLTFSSCSCNSLFFQAWWTLFMFRIFTCDESCLCGSI